MTDRRRRKPKSTRPQPDHPATTSADDESFDLFGGADPDAADDGDQDGEVTEEMGNTEDVQNLPAGRPTIEPPPYCQIHFAAMKLYSTKTKARYYRCQVDGCDQRDATARRFHPDVPASPTWCPRCSQADRRLSEDGSQIVETPGTEVAMVLDRIECTQYFLAMRCPSCGHVIRSPRPDAGRMMARIHRGSRDVLEE